MELTNKTIVIDGVEYNCTPIGKKVEKIFEILALKVKATKNVHKVFNGRLRTLDGRHDINTDIWPSDPIEALKHPDSNWEIYSVKRTSDGEIFTVGDKINGTMSADENPINLGYTTIIGFYLEDNKLCIEISTGVIRNHEYSGPAINLIRKHIEKPILFFTEDGIGIRKGDKFWYISEEFGRFVIHYVATAVNKDFNPHLSFSSNKTALEYIRSHERKYSRQEILDVLNSINDYNTGIIDKAKQKLDL